ncbi:MAG: hypothetical protein WCI19_10755 [Betaproteobacteria bacterium]|nr:hypothetical protein [Rhodocyclales bacterium]
MKAYRKLLAVLSAAILLILGLVFSAALLAVIAVVGLAGWSYLWWKTRGFRRAMKARAPQGEVIEGEAIVVEEYIAKKDLLAGDPHAQ